MNIDETKISEAMQTLAMASEELNFQPEELADAMQAFASYLWNMAQSRLEKHAQRKWQFLLAAGREWARLPERFKT